MRTVTLIGSGRFDQTYQTVTALLTGLGVVVLTHGYHSPEVPSLPENQDQRRAVYDLLMLDKISRADAVLCIDVDSANDQVVAGHGYVGVETAREILWAAMKETPIAFLSDLVAGTKALGFGQAIADFNDSLADGEVLAIHVDPALDILTHVTGRERVAEAQTDTVRNTMHAALSFIADPDHNILASDEASVVAQQTLDFNGLVVLPPDQRVAYLQMIDPASSAHDREVVGG